jgi:hypothetical protein
MKCLGQMGRWGNQVIEYSFLRSYAKKYNLNYQCSPWVGQSLFNFQDPPITKTLSKYTERNTFSSGLGKMSDVNIQWNHTLPPDSQEVVDHDFRGYAQYHTSYYLQHKKFLQKLFAQPAPTIATQLIPAIKTVTSNYTTIGIHLRRGDTGHAVFYLTPVAWYLKWLDENWNRFENPTLFIAAENQDEIHEFSKYNPIISQDIIEQKQTHYSGYNYLPSDIEAGNTNWFPDWFMLANCDVLLIGESSFSFSAAMMNRNLQECWRSVLSEQTFRNIDPWDSYPLVREHLNDFPNIPGTFYEHLKGN